MAENLPRQFGALAADTCVVLCLIILRVFVVAICVSYGKRMSEKTGNSVVETETEVCEMTELKKMPRARTTGERFSLFLEQVERLFPFLIHASIFLLPKDFKPHSSASHNFPFGTAKNGNGGKTTPSQTQSTPSCKHASNNNNNNNSNSKFPSASTFPPPDDAIRQFVEKVLAFRSSNNLDWNNCCVFNLYKGRGPVVQSQPQWPVSCSASYHAGVVASDIIKTGNYTEQGPHFLDWKALYEKGAQSMVAVPMFSCKQVVAVLCLASSNTNAFERENMVWLLASALAPYAEMLNYTTRRMEMQKIVNEIVTPLEPHLMRKKRNLLHSMQHSHGSDQPLLEEEMSIEEGRSGKDEKAVKGPLISSMSVDKLVGSDSLGQKLCVDLSPSASTPASTNKAPFGLQDTKKRQIIKRREPGIGKHHAFEVDQFNPQDPDVDWGDFFFNLISMCIVYAYFSKVAVKGETAIAILLCIGVAALDVVLLLMRWLWFEKYIHYGLVLYIFQIYRVVVVPVANTWMSWRVLYNMEFKAEFWTILLLVVLLVLCVGLGLQTTDRGATCQCGLSCARNSTWSVTSQPQACAQHCSGSAQRGETGVSGSLRRCSSQWTASYRP